MNSIFNKIISLEATGEKLRHLRNHCGFRVSEIKEYLGLSSVQSIYKWEHGVCLPAHEHLLGLSTLYNCPINDLLVSYSINYEPDDLIF